MSKPIIFERKFLILTRFWLFQFYWEFQVFDFAYTFAICAWSGIDPELDRSEFLAKEILLILIRFVLFQVYWFFKVLWFSLYFCNFDLDPELIRNWSGFDLDCQYFPFFSQYFWRLLIILMLIFPISIGTWNPSI